MPALDAISLFTLVSPPPAGHMPALNSYQLIHLGHPPLQAQLYQQWEPQVAHPPPSCPSAHMCPRTWQLAAILCEEPWLRCRPNQYLWRSHLHCCLPAMAPHWPLSGPWTFEQLHRDCHAIKHVGNSRLPVVLQRGDNSFTYKLTPPELCWRHGEMHFAGVCTLLLTDK